MKIARTPDSRFENLPGYDFEPHYTTIQDEDGSDIRIHAVDEGPRDAEPILLMHGNPTWSYLYRKMIPGLLKSGRRVIAVDLVGCGRSDKPMKKAYYTQARHIDWMHKWLEANDIKRITLFCQDWGGIIGLHLVANYPERFDRVVAANTGIPLGTGGNNWLRTWQRVMRWLPAFPLRATLGRSIRNPAFSDEEFTAYKAPFPTLSHQAGILKFPVLIAVFADNPAVPENRLAWEKLGQFDKPFLTLFGNKDPVSRGMHKALIKHIPGAEGQAHQLIDGGGHFIQEDKPQELVAAIIPFLDVEAKLPIRRATGTFYS